MIKVRELVANFPGVRKAAKVAVIFCLSLIYVWTAVKTASSASWMDDWMSNATSQAVGPNFMEGQGRGYATAGSYSLRYPSGVARPVSVAAPSLHIGCGGISLFGGSASFLNMAGLMQHLQGILTNSAFLIFDMALDTLCPKCSALMKAAEALAQKLNSMSINDCNMAKGLTANMRPAMEGVNAAIFEGGGFSAVSDGFSLSYDAYSNQFGKTVNSTDMMSWYQQNAIASPNGTNPFTGACSGIFADIFPSSTSNYPISLMQQVATVSATVGPGGGGVPMPQSYQAAMVGLVGDIKINADMTSVYIPACAENFDLDLKRMGNSDNIYIQTQAQLAGINSPAYNSAGGQACVQSTVSFSSFKTYVNSELTLVAAGLQGSTALGPTELAFIQNTPGAVFFSLRMAIATGQLGTLQDSLAELDSELLMGQSIRDLASYASKLSNLVQTASPGFSNQTPPASANNGAINTPNGGCDLSLLAKGGILEHLKDFRAGVERVAKQVNINMSASLADFNENLKLAQQIQTMDADMRKSVAANLGPALTARATRYLH
jgi:conjugative transfer pilus assembly protein TraH